MYLWGFELEEPKLCIDEACKYLYSKMMIGEWTRLDELSEIVERYGLSRKEGEDVLGFLRKYFLEVDESDQKARLNSWAYNLYKISM